VNARGLPWTADLDDRLYRTLSVLDDDATVSPLHTFVEALNHIAGVPGSFTIHHHPSHPDILEWAKKNGTPRKFPEFTCWDVKIGGTGLERVVTVFERFGP
jgi:hypothetical protein